MQEVVALFAFHYIYITGLQQTTVQTTSDHGKDEESIRDACGYTYTHKHVAVLSLLIVQRISETAFVTLLSSREPSSLSHGAERQDKQDRRTRVPEQAALFERAHSH